MYKIYNRFQSSFKYVRFWSVDKPFTPAEHPSEVDFQQADVGIVDKRTNHLGNKEYCDVILAVTPSCPSTRYYW